MKNFGKLMLLSVSMFVFITVFTQVLYSLNHPKKLLLSTDKALYECILPVEPGEIDKYKGIPGIWNRLTWNQGPIYWFCPDWQGAYFVLTAPENYSDLPFSLKLFHPLKSVSGKRIRMEGPLPEELGRKWPEKIEMRHYRQDPKDEIRFFTNTSS